MDDRKPFPVAPVVPVVPLRPNQILADDALKLAKSSCDLCYGRGWHGWCCATGFRLICPCVAKQIKGKEIVQC